MGGKKKIKITEHHIKSLPFFFKLTNRTQEPTFLYLIRETFPELHLLHQKKVLRYERRRKGTERVEKKSTSVSFDKVLNICAVRSFIYNQFV